MLLTAGEMVICFGGQTHRLSQGKQPRTQPIETILARGPNLNRPDPRERSPGASLLCGVVQLLHTMFNPLIAALPAVMHVSLSRAGELHNLSGVARLMAKEIDRHSLGSGYVVERLLEVLCAEAVRAHIEAMPHGDPDWFRGIKDPIVGRALAAFHLCPGEDWSVQRLADAVAMSPSRFAARFSESLGESPMTYVTKWRMNVACRQLTTTQRKVDQIAAEVGYESHAAFSRTFKKYVGTSPGAWRSRELARIGR